MIIVLKDANFANANLGQIEIPTANLVSLEILGAATVEGINSIYTCRATYDDNTTRDATSLVSWSVASDTYATMSNGVLSIKSAASSPQDVQIIASLNSISTSKTVSVKWADTIDSEAQAILEAYGSKVLTSEQRHTFADFYTTLKTKSWFSKIKKIIMPVLCPTTERLSNLTAVNNTSVAYNIITKSKDTFATSYSAYGDGGYGYAKVGEYGLQKDITATFNNNFSLALGVSNLVNSNACLLYCIKRSSNSSAMTMKSGTGRAYYTDGVIHLGSVLANRASISSNEPNGLLVGANMKNSSTYMVYGYDSTISNVDYRSGNAGAAINAIGCLGGSALSDGSVSFLAVGEGLENEEFLEFIGLVKTLLQALGVIETEQNS